MIDELMLHVKNSKVAIYGAGMIANEAAHCLTAAPFFIQIDNILVTNKENNPRRVLGIPVISIDEAKEKYLNTIILVAVMDQYYDEIKTNLHQEGFTKVISLTFESDLWSEFREGYYKELCNQHGRKYYAIEDELENIKYDNNHRSNSIHVYMAKCHVDKVIKEDMTAYQWEIPIQVGAALTNQRISTICDNQGDSISNRNKEYCELTALYWIWKNDQSSYAGLCHYRRHFVLTKRQLVKLENSNLDVILTIPILNFPNVKVAYMHDHMEADWLCMMKAISQLCPAYLSTAERVENGVFYYGYNMFIAKKTVLNEYCEWLFPILSYCEKECDEKEDKYQNRYIGFLAERLMTIFFLHNEEKYRIAHAKKHFLIQ